MGFALKCLKYLEPPIVVGKLWTLLNSKQNDIFEFRIFSQPLFSQPLNGTSSPKNTPHPGISGNLKKPLKNITLSLFSRFCGTLFDCFVDSTNLWLYGTCNLQSSADMLLDISQIFLEKLFIKQLCTAAVIYKPLYFEKQTQKAFLKASQSSQENTCVRVSF